MLLPMFNNTRFNNTLFNRSGSQSIFAQDNIDVNIVENSALIANILSNDNLNINICEFVTIGQMFISSDDIRIHNVDTIQTLIKANTSGLDPPILKIYEKSSISTDNISNDNLNVGVCESCFLDKEIVVYDSFILDIFGCSNQDNVFNLKDSLGIFYDSDNLKYYYNNLYSVQRFKSSNLYFNRTYFNRPNTYIKEEQIHDVLYNYLLEMCLNFSRTISDNIIISIFEKSVVDKDRIKASDNLSTNMLNISKQDIQIEANDGLNIIVVDDVIYRKLTVTDRLNINLCESIYFKLGLKYKLNNKWTEILCGRVKAYGEYKNIIIAYGKVDNGYRLLL